MKNDIAIIEKERENIAKQIEESNPTRQGKVKSGKRFRKRHLAIILKEGKGAKFKWISNKLNAFTVDKNCYFIVEDGVYISKKNVRFSIYLEGISTPLNHSYIEREILTRTITDYETGESRDVKVTGIKGLKYDSKLTDMLLNTHLADAFTKQRMDVPNLLIIILLIVVLIVGIIGVVMNFV